MSRRPRSFSLVFAALAIVTLAAQSATAQTPDYSADLPSSARSIQKELKSAADVYERHKVRQAAFNQTMNLLSDYRRRLNGVVLGVADDGAHTVDEALSRVEVVHDTRGILMVAGWRLARIDEMKALHHEIEVQAVKAAEPDWATKGLWEVHAYTGKLIGVVEIDSFKPGDDQKAFAKAKVAGIYGKAQTAITRQWTAARDVSVACGETMMRMRVRQAELSNDYRAKLLELERKLTGAIAERNEVLRKAPDARRRVNLGVLGVSNDRVHSFEEVNRDAKIYHDKRGILFPAGWLLVNHKEMASLLNDVLEKKYYGVEVRTQDVEALSKVIELDLGQAGPDQKAYALIKVAKRYISIMGGIADAVKVAGYDLEKLNRQLQAVRQAQSQLAGQAQGTGSGTAPTEGRAVDLFGISMEGAGGAGRQPGSSTGTGR